MSYMDEE